MSQIASFTYLKQSDVPHLGFWSKPKPRFLRRPQCKFNELLTQHELRTETFDNDGVYVALVFAWLDSLVPEFLAEEDPVVRTLREQVEGSHWLVKFADQQLASNLDETLTKDAWNIFQDTISSGEDHGFTLVSFNHARDFVKTMILAIKPEEALLVSIG